jgi:FecR protein
LDSSPLLKSLLSISLSLLLAVTPLYAAPVDTQTAGEVKALIPEASRNAQPVNVKDSLNWNDLLKTGAQGRLRAGLTAGSILSLGSNSELQVVQHDAVSQQTSLVVNYGKLRNQVNKITKPDGKYEVKTPNATIGVIGTDFYVGYENAKTTVICYVGKVAVTPTHGAKVVKSDSKSKDSAAVILVAGQMVVIGDDMPPGGYEAILTPGPVAETSIQDTNVPDQPVSVGNAHHLRRKVLLPIITAGGLGLGLGFAGFSGGGSRNGSSSSQPTIPIDLTNQFGTVNLTNAGIVSKGSELGSYNGIVAPPKKSLGTVSFSTGAFTGANIFTGGTFSSVGSSFSVASGAANYGQPPKGNIFTGSFVGPVTWTLVSQTGKYTDNFTLSGAINGMLYTSSDVTGTATQNVTVYKNQWTQNHEGLIALGNIHLNVPDPSKKGVAGKGSRAAGRGTRRPLFGWQFVW